MTRRLLVVCQERRQYEDWCRVAGIPMFAQHIAVTRNTRAEKLRGLSEVNAAIVWVDSADVSREVTAVLAVYRALAMPEFDCRHVRAILEWLGQGARERCIVAWETLTDEQRLEFLERHPCCRHCGSLDTSCRCWDDS